jgi:hypothetical protein
MGANHTAQRLSQTHHRHGVLLRSKKPEPEAQVPSYPYVLTHHTVAGAGAGAGFEHVWARAGDLAVTSRNRL